MGVCPLTSATLLQDLASDSGDEGLPRAASVGVPSPCASDDEGLSRAASVGVPSPCASDDEGLSRAASIGVPSPCASDDEGLSRAALAKEPYPSAAAPSRAAEEEAWRAAVFEIALQQYLADDTVQPRTKQVFTRLALNGEKPETVTAFLGRGGSGEVYRVERVETGQAAALKVLMPKADVTPESRETANRRFVREAEFLAQNAYSFFPKFYAAGETNGCPYVVMELLDTRPLPSRDRAVAAFLREICTAVRTLHRRGPVHRAIKPANIL